MGFFSGITKAIGGVVKGVTDFASPIISGASSLLSGGLGDVISGGLGYLGQSNANSANADIANAQMAFQERMSNSAYQRATADMRAAGINPMLAYQQGGASSPPGASATMLDAMTPGLNSARAAQSLRSQLDLQKEQVKNTEAQTATARSQTDLNKALKVKAAADALYSTNSAKAANSTANLNNTENLIRSLEVPVKAAQSSAKSSLMGRGLEYFDRFMDSAARLNPFVSTYKSK